MPSLALLLALCTAQAAPAPAPLITWEAQPQAAAPITLTASDGTGLELVAVEAHTVVQDPLAFTELRLTFHNPESRTREGRFAITLPEGADVSRFAMRIGGEWQEGEVVEKQAARRIYEDFLHRRQDPALLEKAPGNQFTARVFPIPANGDKELVLSWSQELQDGEDPLTLPLGGLPKVGRLDVSVDIDRGGRLQRALTHHQVDAVPDGDLSVRLPGADRPVGLEAGAYRVMRVSPSLDASPQSLHRLTVLVDTSASRSAGYAAQVDAVARLLAALPAGTPVRVVTFDQVQEVVFAGQAAHFHPGTLLDRQPLGASDLGAALGWLAENSDGSDRVLVVSDGVPTAGLREAPALEGATRRLQAAGVRRLDAMVVGGLRDSALLGALTTGELWHDGVLLDTEQSAEEQVRRLTRSVRTVEVSAPGAAWVWPQALHGMQPGDEALVYVVSEAEPQVLLDGRAVKNVRWEPAQEPLLERAAVGANLERLDWRRSEARTQALADELTAEIVSLSTTYRVLCDDTALLVLETEQDYARYGLARNGLADILTVTDRGVARYSRPGPVLPKGAVVRQDEPELVDDWSQVATGEAEAMAADGVALADKDVAMVPMESLDMEEAPAVERMEAGRAPAPRRSVAEGRTISRASGSRSAPMAEPMLEPEPMVGFARDRAPAKAPAFAPHGWTGRYAEVMGWLERGNPEAALKRALSWSQEQPGEVLALLAVGECAQRAGDLRLAARAYGSIIDLFPGRADMRRMAAERLESLGEAGLGLAADSYGVAVSQRPDHHSGYRLLALALVRLGEHQQAFEALEAGLAQPNVRSRPGVVQVLQESVGLVGAAWIAHEPARRDEIVRRAQAAGAVPPQGPSTRFVLSWETDANDVDLHVRDANGGHAYYGQRQLASGGALLADVTTGYGPESFVIEGEPEGGSYRIGAHYYRRGPMGYGMGLVQVVGHDGRGGLTIEAHPFVIMTDDATVDVATWTPTGDGYVSSLPAWVR